MDINQLVHSEAAMDIIDNGTWVGDIAGFEGVRLKVCGTQSEHAQKFLQEKQAKMRAKLKGEPLQAEHHDQITKEVFSEVLLKDWEGFTNNGEPLPYSKELAAEWINSRRGKKFFNIVAYCVQKVDENAEAFVQAVEKN